jgi:hypothetical protein
MVINSNIMNEIITDIKALQEETLLNLQNSKASNTVRAYKSDFNDFGLFCAKMDLNLFQQNQKYFLYI